MILASSIAAPQTVVAQSAADSRNTLAPVSLRNTQLRHLKSQRVGSDYQIRVRLPESYDTSTKRYPVLYLMDGDLLFGLAMDVVQYLEWGGLIPELIIVAPAYGSIHSPENRGTNMRNRDFSVFPAQAAYVAGGGERFLGFLREELIPYIQNEFRTDSADRTLAGYSRGADLTLYALFTSPDLFSRYIALDNFYPEYLQLEQSFAARNKDLSKKVFLSGRFPKGGMYELAEKMTSRGYTGLAIEYVDANPRHFAVAGDGLTRGLVSVFNKKSILALLLPLVAEGKIDVAISEYRRLKSSSGGLYDFGEAELSDLGSALNHMRRPEDAIRIYRLNLELYPQSSITHRRIAIAYERVGDKKKALESYRSALQLNPDDRAAAAAVQRLQNSGRP